MAYNSSKTGQGAYELEVRDDGTCRVNGREFPSAQAAYDEYRSGTERSHTKWNICYALEDVLAPTS